jgi:hypothetical protein
MSATVAMEGGLVQHEHSAVRLALKTAKMANGGS